MGGGFVYIPYLNINLFIEKGDQMKDISLIRYSANTTETEITSQFVDCYREVFSDRPWNEWMKCPKCQKYWGKKDKPLLESWKFNHCGVEMVEFWKRDQVLADLQHEITTEASCWLALHQEKVIGFCYGYPVSIADIGTKLGIDITESIKKQFGNIEKVAYQDDVGVLTEYRNQKIAKAMVNLRLRDYISQNLQLGIVRTRELPEPSVTFSWYLKIGYTIIARYPEIDGRVILGRRLDDLSNYLQ